MDTLIPPAPPPRAGAPRLRWLRVIAALVVREMSATFGRSAGGYFWALAEPLGGIALLSLAFSLALNVPPLGTSFPLFYASGMIPFSLFSNVSRGVAGAVRSNKGLLNYPVVTVLDAVFAKFVLAFMTMLVVAVLTFGGIILVTGVHVTLDPGALALGFVLAGFFGLGVGAVNCVLFGLYPTWSNIWSVLTKPLFIISAIFFTYESVPPSFQHILWWNPLVHVIALMRAGLYGAYDPQFVSIPYVLGVSGALFGAGAYLLRRHASLLLER